MTLLSLFFQEPIAAIVVFAGIVLSLGLHEFAHAFAANKLGDPTPRQQGRLTLNPIAHLDPVGTLLIVIVGMGWGKPVQFNPHYLKNPRTGAALIALAGPLTNILIAVVTSLVLYAVQSTPLIYFEPVFELFITLNIALAVFNLIPIEPLDGFKVVGGILPPHLAYQWEDTRQYGIFVLLILLFTGVLDRFIFPVVEIATRFLLTGI